MTQVVRDRYELLEVVAEGGEGRVVKALDRQHGRFVALKLRAVASDADRDLLLNEARVLLALPPQANLPLVRDDFFENDRYVIVMDWVDGVDLDRVLHTRGRPGLAPSRASKSIRSSGQACQPTQLCDVPPTACTLTRSSLA